MPAINFHDTIGKTFGALTILSVLPTDAHNKRMLRARCRCGVEISVNAYNVIRGNSKSCGCLAARLNRYERMPDDKLVAAYTENERERAKIRVALVARNLPLPEISTENEQPSTLAGLYETSL